MCACRETDVRKSAEKFHPFYAAAVFPWWLNALYNKNQAWTIKQSPMLRTVFFFWAKTSGESHGSAVDTATGYGLKTGGLDFESRLG
jgi:hypothetical protein